MNLSVLTWNIWFDLRHIVERTKHIVKMLKSHDCDIVCLQEVILPTLNLLLFDVGLQEKYDFFYDTSLVSIGGKYGEVTLIKKSLHFDCSFESKSFPQTCMGRRINTLHVGTLDLDIINVHLESVFRKNSRPKHDQLKYLSENVEKNSKNAIICGDMNLDKDDDKLWADKIIHDCGITDSCPPNRKMICTYDSNSNTNAYIFNSRLDRIFYKGGLTSNSYELIGTRVIENVGIHPSDHFGIKVKFSIY